MTFDPMPKSYQQRNIDNLAHAQTMLNIIGSLGSYSVGPRAKYDYGNQENAITQQMNSDFLNSVLFGNSDRIMPPRTGAIKRRIAKRK